MNQEYIAKAVIHRMAVQQPKLAANLPNEGAVGVVPHMGLPFPFLTFNNVIYCPWQPLTSKGPV